VDVPFWSLDSELVEESAKKWSDQPALAAGKAPITYRQLQQRAERVTAALQARVPPGAKIVLCLPSPVDLVTAFFGALGGGYAVCLVSPKVPSSQAAQIRDGFRADLFLCDATTQGQATGLAPGAPLAVHQQLLTSDAQKRPAAVDTDAASVCFLSAAEGLVFQSHHTLLAGALSWSTFTAIEPGRAVLCYRRPETWDGLYWALATLSKGGLCVFAEVDDPSLPEIVQQHRPAYAALDMAGVDNMVADPRLPRVVGEGMAGLFVPMEGSFSPGWRRRARNRLGADVLTVYGSAKLGAVLASHPTWYVDGAMGIPVTNVDLWPLDPASHEALDVSWDAVEYGEIGVKSPMIAPATIGSGDKWVPTGLIATMDSNGFYYLLEQPTQWMDRLGLGIPVLDRPGQWLKRLASALPFPRRSHR